MKTPALVPIRTSFMNFSVLTEEVIERILDKDIRKELNINLEGIVGEFVNNHEANGDFHSQVELFIDSGAKLIDLVNGAIELTGLCYDLTTYVLTYITTLAKVFTTMRWNTDNASARLKFHVKSHVVVMEFRSRTICIGKRPNCNTIALRLATHKALGLKIEDMCEESVFNIEHDELAKLNKHIRLVSLITIDKFMGVTKERVDSDDIDNRLQVETKEV